MRHWIQGPDGEPVPADLYRWAQWFEDAGLSRRVAFTELADGAVSVSTVFLGIDHAFDGGPPVLWETMVFHDVPAGGRIPEGVTDVMERYTSRADALRGHALIVAAIRARFEAPQS